jgi:dynein heavy chain
MTFRLKEFTELLDTIQSTQPKDGGGDGGMSKEDQVKSMVKQIKIPESFYEKEYRQKIDNLQMGGIGKGLQVPLNNVLLQEIIRLQGIIDLVNGSLSDIKEALDGKLMMTEEIVKCINALYTAKPPQAWMFDAHSNEISWLSPTAGSWIQGLIIRAEKLREWLNVGKDQRPAFFLPGLLNPQGFFAAFKQEVFKLLKGSSKDLTLDQIDMTFQPHKSETDPKLYEKLVDKSKGGSSNKLCNMLIYGLFIEGAIWNASLQDDPDVNSRTPIIKFPVINCVGQIVDNNKQQTGLYPCPLYKYPKRTDKYHIIDVGLRISGNENSEKFIWQKRGVAMLCNKE